MLFLIDSFLSLLLKEKSLQIILPILLRLTMLSNHLYFFLKKLEVIRSPMNLQPIKLIIINDALLLQVKYEMPTIIYVIPIFYSYSVPYIFFTSIVI